MNLEPLTLFVGADHVSVFAMSAFVALREKGLTFHTQPVDLKAGEQSQGAYREISLTCRVPTLADNGLYLSESSAIAEYLEEAYPSPAHARLYPQDLRQRSRARQLQAWLRSDLQPLRSERPADLFYAPAPVAPLSNAARAAAKKLLSVASTLIDETSEPLFGRWCIADTDLAVMLRRLVANGEPVPAKVQRYVERQWDRPSVQAWVSLPRG